MDAKGGIESAKEWVAADMVLDPSGTFALGIIAAFLGLALLLGPTAWNQWTGFTRILAPLWILGFIAGAKRLSREKHAENVSSTSDELSELRHLGGRTTAVE